MVTLRDYQYADIDRLVELANNKKVSQYLVYTFPFPYTAADAESWIFQGSKMDGTVTKIIEYNGIFVGSVGLSPQAGWRQHCAEIGYWLGEAYWGKGIATRALNMMTEAAFNLHNLKKLYAPVMSPNIASVKVLEKCGYQLEGILKFEVVKDNQYYDIHRFAKLAPQMFGGCE